MTTEEQQQAARFIAEHRLGKMPLPALDAAIRPLDIDTGYAVQAIANRQLSRANLGKVLGHKVGATNPVLQRRLNIAHPVAGQVFATTIHQRSAALLHGDYVRPGVECEVVVHLGRDLPPRAGTYSRAEIEAAIASCAAGMEIIDDRYVDVKTLGAPTLIADNALDAGVVIGAPVTNWQALNLPTLAAATAINGNIVGRGTGADVMGDPINVVVWLANDLSRRGLGLKAGEFVFTGAWSISFGCSRAIMLSLPLQDWVRWRACFANGINWAPSNGQFRITYNVRRCHFQREENNGTI